MSITATLALALWPIVAVVFYWKMPVAWALTATIIGGYLLLPAQGGWDLPVLPPLNKHTIPALAALLYTIVALRTAQSESTLGTHPKGWIPRHPVILGLFALTIPAVFATTLMNGEALFYGPTVLPGLRIYDAFSVAQSTLLTLVPFLLARRVFASAEGQRILLTAIAISGAIYAFLALYEIRMSPQLSNMVYGFFPHNWFQHVRSGGFRPLVFLDHGLLLATFFCIASLSALGLWRVGPTPEKAKFLGIGVWLLLILVLSNSLGAIIIVVAFLPIVLFMPSRLQILLAAGVTVLVLVYPTLRYGGYVPTERILSMARSIDSQRAASLEFRFIHEDQLLAKAKEKALLGWGGWGRSRVYDEESGVDISVTDGLWVIVFGVGGWFHYITQFGLFGVSIVIMAFRDRRYIDPITAVLALVLAANLVDMIPNASASPISWLLAGALAGRLELGRNTASAAINAFGTRGPPQRARLAYNMHRGAPSDTRSQPEIDEAKSPNTNPSGLRFSRFVPKKGRSV